MADATINVSMGAEPGAEVITDELKEKCKYAIYIIRYKKSSWERINKSIQDDNDSLIKVMEQTGALQKYISEHASEFEGNHKEHILGLAYKVLGNDYVRTYNVFKNFGREFAHGEKEAYINKKEPIY